MKSQQIQRYCACLGSALLLVTSTTFGTPSDGTVLGHTKIVDHGPDAQRYTILLISEGYQQSEMAKFATDAQDFVDAFLNTSPFDTNCSIFNFYRVDVTSTNSGADDPLTCADGSSGSGVTVNTYFDAAFCNGGARRALDVNRATVMNVANAQVPGWDLALVLVNTTEYGGTGGGQVGVASLAGFDILIHEFGHSAAGLADEYEYFQGCGVDPAGTHDNHPAVEPVEANVTVQTAANLVKWRTLFFPGITIPTTANADCTKCDPQANPFTEQRVGLYEGAHYFHCDAYRPVFRCKMRALGFEFCPVCVQRLLTVLAPFRPANTAPVANAGGPYAVECTGSTAVFLDGGLSTDVDCNALTFTWTGPFVEGTATGAHPLVHFNGPGSYSVTLVVSDGQSSTTNTASVTVVDTTPPIANCPSNIVHATDRGVCQAVVTFTVSAFDACDPNPLVVASPPSGSVFPKGTTEVTVTATDANGHSSSCTFTVTVVDLEAPRAECRPGLNPGGKKIPGGRNDRGQNPDGFYELLARDNCDPNPRIFIKDSLTPFIAGPFASGDMVKITQSFNPGSQPMPPPIVAHVHVRGDALLYAVDADGNVGISVSCLVPPPPK